MSSALRTMKRRAQRYRDSELRAMLTVMRAEKLAKRAQRMQSWGKLAFGAGRWSALVGLGVWAVTLGTLALVFSGVIG